MNFIKNISKEISDKDLITAYQSKGDLNNLSELYSRYIDLVYGVCLKYLKISEDAKDATIEIFETLIIQVKKHEISHFKPWLYQLSKNHCLMILRKKKNYFVEIQENHVQFTDNEHLQEVLQKEIEFKKMESCIERLQNHQKAAIELFYLQGKCYKEIAKATAIEINQVKSNIQNGRRNLKICMENYIDN